MMIKRVLVQGLTCSNEIHDIVFSANKWANEAREKYDYTGPIKLRVFAYEAYGDSEADLEVYFHQEETQADRDQREAKQSYERQKRLEIAHREVNNLAKDLGYRVELFPLKLDKTIQPKKHTTAETITTI